MIYCLYHYLSERIDTSLLWYSLISLFFINIPLLFDSVLLLRYGADETCRILVANGNNWRMDYFRYLSVVSIHSLLFNSCFYLAYRTISYRRFKYYKFPESDDDIKFFSWPLYILMSYVAFTLFMYYNGISSINSLETAAWTENRGDNRIVNLIVNILVPMSSVSVLVMLCKKQYFYGLIAILPLLLIGFITGARALIIGLVMYLLYFILMKSSLNISKTALIKIVIWGSVAVFLMTFFRKSEFYVYPMNKDVSYEDLFYSYANAKNFTTNGTNTLRLILTGFYRYKTEDVTAVLAGYKYFEGWGTLHPTLLGWAYIDLLGGYWLLAVYLGMFMSFCDRLRHSMSRKYNVLLLAFIFSFLSIALRGSVQYGYATIIYPTILFVVISYFKRNKYNAHLVDTQG